jgi:RNA polymerase sigma-70 factor, ECF subfamily
MKCRVNIEDPAIRKILTGEAESETFSKNQLQELHTHLNQLNVIDRVIMGLVIECQSSKEIADIVGITETNVRVKIYRIKETLKITMKGDHYE